MSRRPFSLFRGSELPRLLFLAAIVLAGWPMIVLFSQPHAPDKLPPRVVRAAELTKIVPDVGVEFQALEDAKPIRARESAAYAALLERTRQTPPGELDEKARRDIVWTHLWERPRLYRGVPVHFEGIAKKILTYEVAPSMSTKGRLYEAWIYSDENPKFPYVVMFEDPPAQLTIGHEVHLRVTVDAYFLKLLSYQAGDVPRAAPMLVGRVRWTPPAPPPPAPMVEFRKWSGEHGFVLVFVGLLGYIALRAFFQLRKLFNPNRDRLTILTSNAGLRPDELSEWLKNLPEEASDLDVNFPSRGDDPRVADR